MDKIAVAIVAAVMVVIMNIFSFSLMARDKRCAQLGKWRVSEKKLFLAAACFGSLGGVLGMRLLHHKTRHWYFRVFFPLMLIAQLLLLAAGAHLLFR